MNLCIDLGNSSTKVGLFEQNKLVKCFSYKKFGETEIATLFDNFPIKTGILSSVITHDDAIASDLAKRTDFLIELSHHTPVPIENRYSTPHTLGNDRLAAIVGATYLKPDSDILVIGALVCSAI